MPVRIHVSMVCDTRSKHNCNSFRRVALPKEMCDEIREYVREKAEHQGWEVDWLEDTADHCPVCKELKA